MKMIIENGKLIITNKKDDIRVIAELVSCTCSVLDNIKDTTLKKILKETSVKTIENISTERSENIC